MRENLEQIARENGRYDIRAIKFVSEGLSFGQTLCEGLRKLALEKWGRLAMLVLNSWGIKTTRDFGEIVWLMINHNLMSAQPTDSINDFDDVYDFQTIFKDQFKF